LIQKINLLIKCMRFQALPNANHLGLQLPLLLSVDRSWVDMVIHLTAD
jgi:hypothetical protein